MNTTVTSLLVVNRRVLNLLSVVIATMLATSCVVRGAPVPSTVDDFSDNQHTSTGAGRIVITDKDIGGHSQFTLHCENGIASVEGDLVPGRGQPGFITLVSPLSPTGAACDVSQYQGVRLRIKAKKGLLSVQVCSADIQNFDYHTSAPLTRTPNDFQEVKIPFASMNRLWSEQTPLNLKAVTSITLVAAGMAKVSFAYEIDELGFY